MRAVKQLMLAGLVGAALAAGGVAWAAIDNSHHDATAVTTATSKCFYCHGIKQTTGSAAAGYGNVGDFCVTRCHSTGGILAAIPAGPVQINADGATDQTSSEVALMPLDIGTGGTSHGLVAANLPTPDDATATGPMQTSTWPYTTQADLQCTSCHAVHDNDRGHPFLWAPMGLDMGAATVAGSFCQGCHDARSDVSGDLTAASPAMGSHPVEIPWVLADAGPGTAAHLPTVANPRHDRTMEMNAYGVASRVFDVQWSDPGVATDFDEAAGNGAITNSYVTGGHVGSGAVAASNGANVGCYTCHSAHADLNNNLTLVATTNTGVTTNPLCVGCHGPGPDAAGTGTSENNPGTTNFYHPANEELYWDATAGSYQASTGGFNFTIANAGLFVFGTSGEVLCTTCHDVHGGKADYMALVDTGATAGESYGLGGITPINICGVCHQTDDSATAGAHHIQLAGDLSAYDPSWATTSGFSLADGMDCTDCHNFNDDGNATGRATAHNW